MEEDASHADSTKWSVLQRSNTVICPTRHPKDYVFDIDRFTSFEGNTGPYILYTTVRIKSILNRYKEEGGNLDTLKILAAGSDSEKALMLEAIQIQSGDRRMLMKRKHRIKSVLIFMNLQMHLTASIMKQRFWLKRIRRRKNPIWLC